MSFDPRGAILWLLFGATAAIVSRHPALTIMVITSAFAVGTLGYKPRAVRTMILVGSVALLMRLVFFSLTGDGPAPYAFHLPELNIGWSWAAVSVGGPVSTQILRAALSEGLTIMAVVACFGAFMAHVPTVQLLSMMPSRLFEAGLVLNIALTFAPSVARSIREVREAQQIRGGGGRVAVRDVTLPVLAGALESSITLAETMESRGFGRGARTTYRRRRRLRAGDWAMPGCAAVALVVAMSVTGSDAAADVVKATAVAILLFAPAAYLSSGVAR